MKRVALLALGALVFFLASEGALSLFLGRSWRDLRPSPPASALDLERERALAARATVGPYRVPEDPLVAYTFKLESQPDLADGKVAMRFSTDDLGMRARVGPTPGPQALRIVVLGDSVAFGFGLQDADAPAAQLERVLAAALPGREVACFTVAVPSWNCRNAWRFLLDHLDRYRPDIVLYLPIDNDLDDSYGTNEAGQRRTGEDPAVPDPLLHVRPEWGYLAYRARVLREQDQEFEPRLGPEVLCASLTHSSRWRLADAARVLAHGRERLARTGAKLALVPHEQADFQRELRAELARAGLAIPEIPLFERMQPDDTLGIDPHPSARTVGVWALWIARSLAELGWLPPAAAASGEVPPGFAARRARSPSAEEVLEASRAYRERVRSELEPRISPETLQGMLQVYGGLNPDGTLEARFAAVLPAGARLRVRLAPIAGRADLYPLEVRVLVNERELGTLSVPGAGSAEAVLALPPGDAGAPFEVLLAARDWGVVTVRGKSWVACTRLVELESLP